MSRFLLILIATAALSTGVAAQIDDICGEVGITPSFDSPFAHVPYIYGRVVLKGYDAGAKLPTITVIVGDGQQSSDRWTVSKTGNYCFKRKPNGSSIVVEVDGVEVARRSLAALGSDQQREDFEIFPPKSQRSKFSHPKNDKTVELYLRAAEAEAEKNQPRAIEHLRAIVAIDPVDFIAWAKLGTLYLEQQKFPESDAAFRNSLNTNVD